MLPETKTRKSDRNEFRDHKYMWKKTLEVGITMAALLSLTIGSSLALGERRIETADWLVMN